jgi:hypothetical protein
MLFSPIKLINLITFATTMVATAELRELSLQVPAKPLSPTMPPPSGVFKMDEDAKAM